MLLPLSSKIINLLFRLEYILSNVGLILSLEPNMTWEILNQKPTESNARDVVVLNRFSNFLGQFDIDPRILDKRDVKITRQAILVIQAMTDFDRKNVIKDIYKIIDNPKRASLTKHSRNPFWRLARNIDPFRAYHFLILYRISDSGSVVIEEIMLDSKLHGSKLESKKQRTMLYDVRKETKSRYSEDKNTNEDIQSALNSWDGKGANIIPKINCEHVTINGMNNDYDTASKLMGVHTDVAYRKDNIVRYNLFHNPTDGGVFDLAECIFDQTRIFKSRNAKQLASLIIKTHSERRRVKWTVHSQGAIIFRSAIEEVKSLRPELRLDGHELAVHSPGGNYGILSMKAKRLGMKVQPLRANPADFVPNVIGLNGVTSITKMNLSLSPVFIWACFLSKTIGGSPHSLPYLGLNTYEKQLRESGARQKARVIGKYAKIGKH
ncbi:MULTISPECIES: hypothetical protein [Vibrio]|uniref:hypothetical protein n=1 Tax=Vibrio TaxID=662 RepID=UPI001F178217|nr:hypothetical protein [Vibrio sp. A1-1]MCF7453301.1 hypothetical protein [Vibrio sp. A1-1]